MTRHLRLLAAAAISVLVVTVSSFIITVTSTPKASKDYYLALGDSLARGIQPNATGTSVVTSNGYANDLYEYFRRFDSSLHLENLGCLGETSWSMVHGAWCIYDRGRSSSQPAGDQLAQAVWFLQHRTVKFVTLDIGANDVSGCITLSGIDFQCYSNALETIRTNVSTIVQRLRLAAPNVPIYAMNYYDPFLVGWLYGATGRTTATKSISLTTSVNQLLQQIYTQQHVVVADVERSFHTTDTQVGVGSLQPIGVATICSDTWMCAPPPRGPNYHANSAGYKLIAETFEKIMRPT